MDAAAAVGETCAAYLALGHRVSEGPGVRIVSESAAPWIYDANLFLEAGARSPDAAARALGHAEQAFAGAGHRHAHTGPATAPAFCAALAHAGYAPKPTLQMLLPGPLAGAAPHRCELAPLSGEADWSAFHALLRADHEEGARTRRALDAQVTAQMVAVKRAKAPAVQFFLARVDGAPAGFFSAWPGVAGVGLVEDLFVLPALRGRGIARALIHRAVADARERGADQVVIGADPAETPRHIYAALGFRPVCLTWSWLRLASPA